MRELAVNHVRDRLETTVRMPIGAPRLTRLVVHLTHLVHMHERVQGGGAHSGERPDDREALAFVASRTCGDRSDRALRIGWTGGADPWQCERVCGYRRHIYLLF